MRCLLSRWHHFSSSSTLDSPNGGIPQLCNTSGAGIFQPVVNCPNITDPQRYVSFSQSLWPPHCVQNTPGADLFSQLHVDPGADHIVKKGTICSIDSYSAFEDNGGFGRTGLQALLDEAHVNTVFITGLTLDFCVKFTALDAKNIGYDVFVVLDATKATSPGATKAAVDTLLARGVHVISSADLSSIGLNKQPPTAASLAFGLPMLIGAFALLGLFIRFLLRPNEAQSEASGPFTHDDEAASTEDESASLLEH